MPYDVTAHMDVQIGRADAHYLAYSGSGGAVHRVRASADRPWTTLYTDGMRERALPNRQPEDPSYVELVVRCPKGWFRDDEGGAVRLTGSDQGDWLVKLLQWTMQAPWRLDFDVYPGSILTNGDPPVPYAEVTRFCGVLFVPVLCVAEDAQFVQVGDHRVQLLSLVLLDAAELKLADEHGIDALLEALDGLDVSDLVQPDRASAS
jgi:hypothetical protein